MKLVTVLNNKGGCGKTFCAVVLAELLMIAGKRVAVVDLDTQLDAVKALRMMDGENVFPNVDVIASPGEAPDFAALRSYDFVIADCPPQIITSAAIQATIAQTDVFIIPVCLQQNSLFGFDKTLEYLPGGRPIIPVCSMGPEAKTQKKIDLLKQVKDLIGEGEGDLLPGVFLPWYDRVDVNISARRDFFYTLREDEFAKFDALRAALFAALGMK